MVAFACVLEAANQSDLETLLRTKPTMVFAFRPTYVDAPLGYCKVQQLHPGGSCQRFSRPVLPSDTSGELRKGTKDRVVLYGLF